MIHFACKLQGTCVFDVIENAQVTLLKIRIGTTGVYAYERQVVCPAYAATGFDANSIVMA